MSPAKRLQRRDYSAPGLYFITACSDFKRCIFGKVENGEVSLSNLGRIVEKAWFALANQFSRIRLHGHMVMPNHVHGIIEISSVEQAQQAAPLQRAAGDELQRPRSPSLSIILRSFKANVTRRAGIELGWKAEIWQHNYFDRVIRDGREFANASRYIAGNPGRWQSQGERMKADQEARLAQQAAPLQKDRV